MDDSIARYKERRKKRRESRYDFEVGEFPPDEPGDKKSHGNTRLPYGLCKSAGIDTTGMTPSEAWKALEGETGVGAKEAYGKLEKYGSAKGIDIKKYAEEGDIAGTEEMEGKEIPEPFPKVKPKSKAAIEAIEKLNSTSDTKSEEDIQKVVDKLKEEYGENGYVGFITSGGRYHVFSLSHDMTASNIEYFKKGSNIYAFAGGSEEAAKKEAEELIKGWKKSGDVRDVVRAYDYELINLRKDKHTGKISEEEYNAAVAKTKQRRNKRVLKALPSYESCSTVEEVALRAEAQDNFKQRPIFSSSTDIENAREMATSAERMFSAFPTMKHRVGPLNTTVYKKNSYAWVNGVVGSGIYVSSGYASDRKKMVHLYKADVKGGFHPPGTDSRAIVYHEFTHVIDMNLSSYIQKHGGIPGYAPGTMLSTVIATEMAKARKTSKTALKEQVSGYAKKQYKKNAKWNELEFMAECMCEYFGSEHPREIAVECATRLFGYMKQFWGDDAVSEEAMKKATG